ncbi:MAG: hypothetical protein IT258_17655 [Saprospiraceae bacterium]|nr:hypothetical protein [Saprospiraceae bacterium]
MRTVLFVVSLLFGIAAKAQEWQGRGVVGGSVGLIQYNSNITDSLAVPTSKHNNAQVSFSPHFGYRVNEKWLIGLRGGFVQDVYKTPYDKMGSSYEIEYRTYFASLFFRRYFKSFKKIIFFLEPALEYKYQTNAYDFFFPGSDYKLSARQYSMMVAPGAIYSLSKRINLIARFGRLDAGFGTNWASYPGFENNSNFVGLDFNFETFNFGAEFKL